MPWQITKLPRKDSVLGYHRTASETPFKCFVFFCWLADDVPLLVVYWVFIAGPNERQIRASLLTKLIKRGWFSY